MPPPQNQTPPAILIVEDSPTQAERLRYLLEAAGYAVRVAPNGRLALVAVTQAAPDLVISDLNMPEMDGFELSKQLRADPRWQDVPVLLLTSLLDPQDVIQALACGADSFVPKPYAEADLLHRVHQALAHRQMRDDGDGRGALEVLLDGRRHVITANRVQILHLLLSTYEAVAQRGKELARNKESLERRSAELALSNRFLDSVIENLPHPVYVKDAHALRYVRVNRAVETLLNVPRQQLLGRGDDDLFPPERALVFSRHDRAALASGLGDPVNELIETETSGTRVMLSRKLAIPDESGRPQFLLGISEDVTEKHRVEQEILRLNAELARRSAEANAASEAKSAFLASMSHEIRTPMNGMLGMLELLALTGLDPQQREMLEVVRASSESLLRIVDDILDFSKIEAGQMEIRPEPMSVSQVLTEVERTYASAAGRKGLKLRTHVDPDLPEGLLADSLRLRQILGNFVSNSVKFTERGGVDLSAERIGRNPQRGEHVRFKVRDTGIGISLEEQRRLFQPFSQGAAARSAGGTGLGLTICRRLAHMMDGSVQMDSELGRGTTMTLDLWMPHTAEWPVASAREALPRMDTRTSGAGVLPPAEWKTCVLLVDDHPTNRALLVRQLRTLGYTAEAAADAREALARWRSGGFDLVLTDCEMPGMSGYELASRIRVIEADQGLTRTPIIACTAHALTDELGKCIASGMDDYLTKPVDLASLRTRLELWLRPRATHEEPLDLSLVAETWGDDEQTIREILQSFRLAGDEDAAALRQAATDHDSSETRRRAHRMQGSSKMMGAQNLAEACRQIEMAARAEDWPAVQTRTNEFSAEWQRVCSWIETRRKPSRLT